MEPTKAEWSWMELNGVEQSCVELNQLSSTQLHVPQCLSPLIPKRCLGYKVRYNFTMSSHLVILPLISELEEKARFAGHKTPMLKHAPSTEPHALHLTSHHKPEIFRNLPEFFGTPRN